MKKKKRLNIWNNQFEILSEYFSHSTSIFSSRLHQIWHWLCENHIYANKIAAQKTLWMQANVKRESKFKLILMRQLVLDVFFLLCCPFSSVNKKECRQIFAFFCSLLQIPDKRRATATIVDAVDVECLPQNLLLYTHSTGKLWSIAQERQRNILCFLWCE